MGLTPYGDTPIQPYVSNNGESTSYEFQFTVTEAYTNYVEIKIFFPDEYKISITDTCTGYTQQILTETTYTEANCTFLEGNIVSVNLTEVTVNPTAVIVEFISNPIYETASKMF
jgi:hypothetical protein